jgi:hypothetical protein
MTCPAHHPLAIACRLVQFGLHRLSPARGRVPQAPASGACERSHGMCASGNAYRSAAGWPNVASARRTLAVACALLIASVGDGDAKWLRTRMARSSCVRACCRLGSSIVAASARLGCFAFDTAGIWDTLVIGMNSLSEGFVTGARRCYKHRRAPTSCELREDFRAHDCAEAARNVRRRLRDSSSHNCQFFEKWAVRARQAQHRTLLRVFRVAA